MEESMCGSSDVDTVAAAFPSGPGRAGRAREGAHRLHERGEVIQREVGDVAKHHQALEVVFLHRLRVTLHKVHRLRGRGGGWLAQGNVACFPAN